MMALQRDISEAEARQKRIGFARKRRLTQRNRGGVEASALIESFGRSMRENLTTGSTPFRKVYLRILIDVIEVIDAKIRIKAVRTVGKRFCQSNAN